MSSSVRVRMLVDTGDSCNSVCVRVPMTTIVVLMMEGVRGVLLHAIAGRLSLRKQTARDNRHENNFGCKHDRNADFTTFRVTNVKFVCCIPRSLE